MHHITWYCMGVIGIAWYEKNAMVVTQSDWPNTDTGQKLKNGGPGLNWRSIA